ncbi:hypothetical protein [Rhodococcus kronopolitis]|uniref:Transcriptional regulator n=1 Tax=Rhodococcus kronopolitis TaxID=1460226 RepID=A0ABV9FNY4_9NOCA
MNTLEVTPSERRRIARIAVDALGPQRSDHALVRVTCPASHHVATVYRTAEGSAVVAGLGPRSHGSRDFVDTAHHGDHSGSEFVDLLAASRYEDDELPASCACGARTLSRRELLDAVVSHTKSLTLP